MQHAFTEAVRMHLDTAFGLPASTVSSFHTACYKQARQQYPLPASTIQQARDKALSIYRSVRARRHKKRKASQLKIRRLLPLRIDGENLRVLPGQKHRPGYHPQRGACGFRSLSPKLGNTSSSCRTGSPNS